MAGTVTTETPCQMMRRQAKEEPARIEEKERRAEDMRHAIAKLETNANPDDVAEIDKLKAALLNLEGEIETDRGQLQLLEEIISAHC